MCMELLTAVMILQYKYQGLFDGNSFNASADRIFERSASCGYPVFEDFFVQKLHSRHFSQIYSFPSDIPTYSLPSKSDLYNAFLFTWCWMHSKRKLCFKFDSNSAYSAIQNNPKELLKFAETINLMQ